MTSIQLKENSSALDCIAAELTNVDKIEVLKNVSDYLRKLARSDVDPKAHNDQITALCNQGEFMVAEAYKIIETLRQATTISETKGHMPKETSTPKRILNLELDLFRMSEDLELAKVKNVQSDDLLTRCLDTGAIRADSDRELWFDINKFLHGPEWADQNGSKS